VSRRTGWRLATGAVAGAALAVLLVPAPASADERGPMRFQPVELVKGVFVGAGKDGPFTGKFKNGVKFGSSDVEWSKVTELEFDKPTKWGSRGTETGMIITNASGKPICTITITSTSDDTFTKELTKYGMPSNWTVKVSADGKTLTLSAVKPPDDCIPKDGYFWMMVPASTTPDEGKATLTGQLGWLDPGPQTQPGTPEPSATA
jgi:hypothetical protein